jgi:hypothetical protein
VAWVRRQVRLPLGFFDPLKLADRIARRGFMQYSLLHRPGHNGPPGPSGIRRVPAPLEIG